MAKKGVRSDIPYVDRLLMEKYNTVREHRNDAARTALKIGCVALNNTEKLGYTRLVRYAIEQQRLTEAYYKDPEVEEKHLNDRLSEVGFVMRNGRMLGALDADGKPIKASELIEAPEGAERFQMWSGWIKVKDRLPDCFVPVLTARKDKDGSWKIEQGIRMIDDQWKVFGTRTKGVSYWMAMPDAPVEG